jgi:hypothetical protein
MMWRAGNPTDASRLAGERRSGLVDGPLSLAEWGLKPIPPGRGSDEACVMDQVLKMPRYETVEAAARSLTPRRRIADPRRRGDVTRTERRRLTLDRGLELLEQRRLSATELRLLLALLDGEAPVRTLAQTLRLTDTQVRRAGARLYVRNLIRWRDGDDRATMLDVTPAGLATVRPLLAAAGHAAPGAVVR